MAEYRPSGKRSSAQDSNGGVEPRSVSQALRKEGHAGGVSGTGQAWPHHGFEEADDEARLSTPDTGSSYQAGGTHLNRERQVATRKARLAGSTIASKAHDGRDPPPGAPASRS
jgi:hypothetical protein